MRWLIGFIVILTLALLLVGGAALSPAPTVTARHTLDQEDVRALRSLAREQLKAGGALRIDGDDANRLLRWGLQQRDLTPPWQARVQFQNNIAHLDLSRNLSLPMRPWLNLALEIKVNGNQPHIEQAHIGHLPLPRQWVEKVLQQRWRELQQQALSAWGELQQLSLQNGLLEVHYQLASNDSTELQRHSAALWFGPEVETLLLHYQKLLADRQLWPSARTSLSQVLQTLLLDAADRKGDPVAEHTAILLALAQQESDPAMAALLQLGRKASSQWLQPTLYRRRDLAQHFVLAGALSLYAGDNIADQLGLLKELEDSDGHSGFGAADLLADRAGIAFAQAMTSPERAAELQARLAEQLNESDIMPSPRQVPTALHKELEQLARSADEHAVRARLNEVLGPLIQQLPALQ